MDSKITEIKELKAEAVAKTNQITEQAFEIMSQCKKNITMAEIAKAGKEAFVESVLEQANATNDRLNNKIAKCTEFLENYPIEEL